VREDPISTRTLADPQADGAKRLEASLRRVLQTGASDSMAVQRYDVRDQISGEDRWLERYWFPRNYPVPRRENGEIAYIIHHVKDVTEFVNLRRGVLKQEFQDAALRKHTSSDLGTAGNEFIANLQRLIEARRKKVSSSGAWQVPQYLLPGSRVSASGIYGVFHTVRCGGGCRKAAFWCGDVFPRYGCCGPELRYRFCSSFD